MFFQPQQVKHHTDSHELTYIGTVTIPILDDIITSLRKRFTDDQDTVIKRTMLLLPCNTTTNPVTEH